MVLWVKGEDGHVERVEDRTFAPDFFVHGDDVSLNALADSLSTMPMGVLEFDRRKIDLGSEATSRVLRVGPMAYRDMGHLADQIAAMGRYRAFELYNVDVRLEQRYLLQRGLFPFARVATGDGLTLRDDMWATDYDLPPLREMSLAAELDQRGRVKRFSDPLKRLFVGGRPIYGGSEEVLLETLVETLREEDPDIVYTNRGNAFLLPYLYRRADVHGMLDDFQLGREPQRVNPNKRGKSYFSYGRILYKPPAYDLRGRLHVDRGSSFLHMEGGLQGLIELSRISLTPLQSVAKTSPGTSVSALQVNQAMRDGYLIKWKKNRPEDFKTAEELRMADRGGFTFEPVVGLHENVLEVDFTSLYPSIMVRFNISPETLLCGCCLQSERRVPELGYNICDRRVGLIAKTLDPVIQRRIVYKRRGRENGNAADKERSDVLKWLLVCCLDGETLVPVRVNGEAGVHRISEVIDPYLPANGALDVDDGLRVFGLDGNLRTAERRVKRVFKMAAPPTMVEVTLGGGKPLLLTPNHQCYVLQDGGMGLKRADTLRVGDRLPILQDAGIEPLTSRAHSVVIGMRRVPPNTPSVYCFEVGGEIPGFAIEGGVLTHNSFGYTGYKNARYGRIECHESITAYGREILLRSAEMAQRRGYEVLHGIVDSLWLKPTNGQDPKRLVARIGREFDIPLEIEGRYKWLVFLPCKTLDVGAMNRYYGAFDDGRVKIRGIQARRHDSPRFIKKAQRQMIDLLAEAGDAAEFVERIPDALEVAAGWARQIQSGTVSMEDLLVTIRVSKPLEEYVQFNDQVAALTQLKEEGVDVEPGQVVEFVITDSESKDARRRVRVRELWDGEAYDAAKYVELLARACEELLAPFGSTAMGLEKRWSGAESVPHRLTIAHYDAP